MRKEFGNHFSTEILYGEILRAMLSVTANICLISPYDELTWWPAGVQCYIMMVTWISSVTCHTLWRLAVTRVTGVTVKSQIIIRHHLILAEQQWYSQISNMQWTLYTWSVRGLHITADSTSKLGFVEEPENQKTLLEWGPIDPSSAVWKWIQTQDPDSHETGVTAVMTREHVNIAGIMPDEVRCDGMRGQEDTGGYTRLWGHEPPLLAIKQAVKQVTKAQQSVERILENRKRPDS